MRPHPSLAPARVWTLACASLFVGALLPVIGFGAPEKSAAPSVRKSEQDLAVYADPVLRQRTPPVYPPQALRERRAGMATIRLIVGEDGKVVSARALEDSDEEFAAPALAAAKSWVFAPALEEGKPVRTCLDTLITFNPGVGQETASTVRPEAQRCDPSPRTPAEPKSTPLGEYPSTLSERKLIGLVKFNAFITADGQANRLEVTAATHSDFVLPAIAALNQWKFKPAMKGDLPVGGAVTGTVSFDVMTENRAEILAANDLTAPDGSVPNDQPQPLDVADAVYPFEALLKGESGTATVDFTITETGYVQDVQIVAASRPEFGASARAAMEGWIFRPAGDGEHAVAVKLRRKFNFEPPVGPDGKTDADPLVLALRAGTVTGAKGLDTKLAPVYRVPPQYPESLKAKDATAGSAEVEFIIDHDGRVRWPRVISATQPEFGWAAATAALQWVFRPPTRGGQPTDVRVRLPFQFSAPSS